MSETGFNVLSALSLIELNDLLSILKLPRAMQRDALALRMRWSVWDAERFLEDFTRQAEEECSHLSDDELTAIAEASFELDDALESK